MTSPLHIGLAISLALSLAGNALLGRAYLGQRDKATVAVVETKQVTGAAVACSKGTESLVTQAVKRKAAAAPEIAAAKQQADAGDKRADVILATPPVAPGDDCRSAQARVDTWWESRK